MSVAPPLSVYSNTSSPSTRFVSSIPPGAAADVEFHHYAPTTSGIYGNHTISWDMQCYVYGNMYAAVFGFTVCGECRLI